MTFAEIRPIVLAISGHRYTPFGHCQGPVCRREFKLESGGIRGHSGLNLRFQAIGTRHLFIALYLFTLLKLLFALCQLHLNTQPAPARLVVWPGPIKLVRQPTPRS